MAVSKALIASIFLCLVLVHQVQSQGITSNGGVASSNIPRITELSSNALLTGPLVGALSIVTFFFAIFIYVAMVWADCGGACAARCQLSKRPNLCRRICGTCCFRCNCVPPGTYGNFAACPCYASLTTRNNKRKCP